MNQGWQKICILSVILCLAFMSPNLSALPQANPILRVGLLSLSYKPEINITCQSTYKIILDNNSTPVTVQPKTIVNISKDDSFILIKISKQSYKSKTIKIVKMESYLQISNDVKSYKSYRGDIELSLNKNGILLVNILQLEDYLLGVVPAEMGADHHIEALKAQSIAARSFAYHRIGHHANVGYDLCDQDDCQVYFGVNGERARTSDAVKATANTILTYKGAIAECVYHADCGGITASSDEMGFGSKLPYLINVIDSKNLKDFCSGGYGHIWKYDIPKEKWQAFLKAMNKDIGEIKTIEIKKLSSSKRVKEAVITGKKGDFTFSGVTLRKHFGYSKVLSTRFSVQTTTNGWQLIGQGYGHGVGMCQNGAQGRALSGQTYNQILQTYYPGTELTKLILKKSDSVKDDNNINEQQVIVIHRVADSVEIEKPSSLTVESNTENKNQDSKNDNYQYDENSRTGR